MSDRLHRIHAALHAVDWIAQAGDEVVTALGTMSRCLTLRKGEALFGRGQMFRHVAVIASGFIQSSLLSRDGHEHLTSIMGRGQVLGFNGLFLDHPAQGSHVATSQTNVVLIPGDTLLHQMRCSNALMLGVLREQSRRNEHLAYLLGDRQMLSHRVRVARVLLLLWAYCAPTAAPVSPEAELRLSQQRLAELAAMTRQGVGQVLKQLQEDGLIEVRYSSIALRDLAGLQNVVDQES